MNTFQAVSQSDDFNLVEKSLLPDQVQYAAIIPIQLSDTPKHITSDLKISEDQLNSVSGGVIYQVSNSDITYSSYVPTEYIEPYTQLEKRETNTQENYIYYPSNKGFNRCTFCLKQIQSNEISYSSTLFHGCMHSSCLQTKQSFLQDIIRLYKSELISVII